VLLPDTVTVGTLIFVEDIGAEFVALVLPHDCQSLRSWRKSYPEKK